MKQLRKKLCDLYKTLKGKTEGVYLASASGDNYNIYPNINNEIDCNNSSNHKLNFNWSKMISKKIRELSDEEEITIFPKEQITEEKRLTWKLKKVNSNIKFVVPDKKENEN